MNINNWQTQLRKGLLELAILNLLYDHRRHGYEMVQSLKQLTGFKIREGNIYPVLARLEAVGIVSCSIELSRQGPPRKYFEITELGRAYLSQMNDHWDIVKQNIDQLRK